MNGSEVFNFTLHRVPILVNSLLEKYKMQKEDVDLFIFHQANGYILEFLRKKLAIDTAKFYLYVSEVGNTVSSTIPIALFEALSSRVLKKNMKTMLAGFGVGYSWGGCILFS